MMREKRLFYNPFGYRMDFFVEPEFLLAKKIVSLQLTMK